MSDGQIPNSVQDEPGIRHAKSPVVHRKYVQELVILLVIGALARLFWMIWFR